MNRPSNLTPSPSPANPAAGMGGRLADAASKVDPLLAALVVFIWTSVWRIQDIFPILGKIQLPMLMLAVVVGLFAADKTPSRRLEWAKSPVFAIILALLVIMILGLPTSLWPSKGISFITRDFMQTLVLCVVVVGSVRDYKDLERLAFWGMLVGGLIYAGEAFLFRHSMVYGRLVGLAYYDANDFGMLIGTTIPFAIFFLRPGAQWTQRLVALLFVAIGMIMLVRTGSRGAFLALITVTLYITFLFRAIPAKIRLTSVVAGVGMLVVVGGEQYWTLMKSIMEPEDDYNMTSETGRKAVWKRGMGYMWAHPFLGTGVRTFPQAEGQLSELAKQYAEIGRGIKWSVAHNSFVETGAELGVIALVLFVCLFLVSLFQLARVRVADPKKPPPARGPPIGTVDDKAYAQMLSASFLGFMVGGFFVSAQYFSFLYVLLGLTVALLSVIRRRPALARAGALPAARPGARTRPGNPPLARPPAPRRPTTTWVPSG